MQVHPIGRHYLAHGDCIEVMRLLPESSIDACVTDPPYGLGFMGKHWDGMVPGADFARELLRVLKPGAHACLFGGTRTYHRLAVALEDAGFEIRDCLSWNYGSGFPKSLDVSKAIDKEAGAKREIGGRATGRAATPKHDIRGGRYADGTSRTIDLSAITVPATDAARQWQGWGTALKPAWEPILLVRKPLIGTVAANVQAHGTGGLNIDACRIASATPVQKAAGTLGGYHGSESGAYVKGTGYQTHDVGRWPANVCLDEVAAAMLDEQSGTLKSGANPERRGAPKFRNAYGTFEGQAECTPARGADTGGASRFFYTAKPSRAERDLGCDHLPARTGGEATDREDGAPGATNPRSGAGRTGGARNIHPTVKPAALIRWLLQLVTPPGGVVLDPFCGSGTIFVAAKDLDLSVAAIEREAEYLPIALARGRASV